MTDSHTEETVKALIAEYCGVDPRKVATTSRLFHDLKLDGDDAVEFFEEFRLRFDVDLTPLHHHWNRHFGPEGFGTPKDFLFMAILALLPPLLLMPMGVSPMWGWGAALMAVVGWWIARKQWPLADDTLPITVADLVSAATSHRWPIKYTV